MIGTYPPKYGLYDPITNRPIFYDGIIINGEEGQDGRGIYDSTIRGKYLNVRMQIDGYTGNPAPAIDHPDYLKLAFVFTGIGLSSGLSNAHGYTSFPGIYDPLNPAKSQSRGAGIAPMNQEDEIGRMNRLIIEPDRFKRSLFNVKSATTSDWPFFSNILFTLDIGKINGFSYGSIAVRFATLSLWDSAKFPPNDPPPASCPPVDSWGYHGSVHAFISDAIQRYSDDETSSSGFNVPFLSFTDYSVAVPGSEARVATISVDKETDAITFS